MKAESELMSMFFAITFPASLGNWESTYTIFDSFMKVYSSLNFVVLPMYFHLKKLGPGILYYILLL